MFIPLNRFMVPILLSSTHAIVQIQRIRIKQSAQLTFCDFIGNNTVDVTADPLVSTPTREVIQVSLH